MAAPSTKAEFLDIVRKSGVLDEDRLQQYLAKNPSLPEQAKELAAVMVRDGILTNLHASQFMLGKYKGFVISGKYRVLSMLGSGGMGKVYLCEHIFMRRLVALKVLPAAPGTTGVTPAPRDPSAIERFYREARAVASLDHPNIVRAFDIDRDEKIHYLVMEYVDGISMHDYVKKNGPMEVAQAAQCTAQAAAGLQHAHVAGWVHRDIKPGNLLMDRQGVVKILDMGLARFFPDRTDQLTKNFDDQSVLGTADYIAPEQAMNLHDVDIRADIYSLGATFYYLLAGKAPFEEGSITQKLLWHQLKAPAPIRNLRAAVPGAVADILTKMMAKDPAQRYQTPAEVAEALNPWCQTPVSVPAESEIARRVSVGTGSAPVTAKASASAVLRHASQKHVAAASQDTNVVEQTAPIPDQQSGPSTLAPRKRKREKHGKRSSGNQLILWGAAIAAIIVIVVGSVVFALAVFKSGESPQTSQAQAPAKNQPAAKPNPQPQPNPKSSPKPTPKPNPPPPKPGGSEPTYEALRMTGHTAHVDRVAVSPDGRYVLSAGHDNTARLWDVQTGKQVRFFKGHTDMLHCVAFSPDGRFAVTASRDKTVRMWDVETGADWRRFDGHDGRVWAAVFLPDGNRIFSGGEDKVARLWDVNSRKEIRRFQGHSNTINSVAVSTDGKQALTASWDKTVRLWDVDTGKQLKRFDHKENVTTVVFSPDGKHALTGSNDKIVRLWDLNQSKEVWRFEGHTDAVWNVAFSQDGSRALSGSKDSTIRLWDVATGTEVRVYKGHGGGVTGVAFHPEGKMIVSSSADKTVRLWGLW